MVDKDEVTSVKQENVKEVIVNFGTKVTRESAEDKDNYSITKNIKKLKVQFYQKMKEQLF